MLLVLMGGAAGIFARDYDAVRLRLARDELLQGMLEADNRPDDAVEHYRAALALDPENPAIRRALAVSLLELGRSDEAETHLIELLQVDPIDAEANLLRAHIAVRRRKFADAETFYQRAIYGRWGDDGGAGRIAARFELADLLSRTGKRIQARAELLRLQAELPEVPPLQHELAERFMGIGDPAQAADVLQRLMKAHPGDATAAERLTDALLALGRFREARDAASHALALDPQDRSTRRRVDQINEALSLDPTVRGLSPATRMRRSGELLARVLQDVESCLGAVDGSAAAGAAARGAAAAGGVAPAGAAAGRIDWSGLRSRAQSALAAKPTPMRDTDAIDSLTDQRLAIVDELWRLRVSRCGTSDGPTAWVVSSVEHFR